MGTTDPMPVSADERHSNITALDDEFTSIGYGVLALNYFVALTSCIIFSCDVIGISILKKCKRIPRQCRYLSISFLLSDAVGAAFFFIHQIVIFVCGYFNDITRNSRTVVVSILSIISFASVAALSLERVISLKANIKYHQTVKTIHTYLTIAVVWMFHSCLLVGIISVSFVLICNFSFESCDVWSVTRAVRHTMFGFMIFYDLVLVVSNTIVYKIALRHRRQILAQTANASRRDSGNNHVPLSKGQHAATEAIVKLVTAYLVLQAPMTINVIITEYTDIPRSDLFHRVFRTVSYLCIQINSFINLSLYVAVFQECKMHFYLIMAKMFKSYRDKADGLRYQVFSIVTYGERSRSSDAS